ncbi:MAG: hypothetical protein DI544_14375 [Sphingomonas taxi]|uniref:SnoaL-like domain-containing protein n=1 Tax=Sphingomonas taxi TaxID=1549858 RepID=A0A2W5QKN7_9SPHN|nr:MAG: hypothetical protein DI544_14375 [Sphingomonas taxi]
MTRDDYERYKEAFNRRDYDTVFDFYADDAKIAFFGVEISDREEFRQFYSFLHSYFDESLTIERFASSDELVALEGVIRIVGKRDLDRATLDERGLYQFSPLMAGQVIEMRQYIHYAVRDGKFVGVGCALA